MPVAHCLYRWNADMSTFGNINVVTNAASEAQTVPPLHEITITNKLWHNIVDSGGNQRNINKTR